MADTPVIEISGLWFSYDGRPVLRDVNLTIAAGPSVCMVGPNGGGKTTLLKLILGLLRPNRGKVRVFGQTPEAARSRVGYAPQHTEFDPEFPVSVMDVVLLGRLGKAPVFGPFGKSDRRAAAEALEEVELYDLRKRPFANLSGGQRQRVTIARALASEPELLLLDEPTASLDIGAEAGFYELLRTLSERMSLLVVSHDVGFVTQLATKVVCVRKTVAVHPTAELTGEMMRDLYGHDVRLVRHDHNCLDNQGEDCDHE